MTVLLSPKGTFPAKIIDIISPYQLVMNRGKQNNIQVGWRVLVYEPTTEEIQGRWESLEILKGRGRVISVEENEATIKLDCIRIFNDTKIGDLVKPI
ncbi:MULTISPECIES: hypothetical protein [unclassified Microcystis]|jgi:hypothetical protein|uniref:hypothetical protein n=1 Tax=unclassified Microcystis TaxID=2643300 RepID=UPI00258F1BC3|nr:MULTISPECIES: hypothetical protein [unclassified Microcystis]MCA2764293.1 hypothetical protein [Microcystis sp. M151S2]MCA2642831.1 hypothetical protein [Microcystis sp. M087S2]MCA2672163.1 hypothetical protein [Microcystis sp. M080S2]MCA2687822.1 hypothetical protein [Microcystis sp. M037S2]MCA2735137.1 hypothetical protein [Microcystis sp. M158S2]